MSGGPLDLAAAERLVGQHLGMTPRAAHSRFVGLLLEALAAPEQRQLWRLVGLVHDLDYFAVGEDWSRHGRLTAEWLAGLLPTEALAAIAAHDHRSGESSDTPLTRSLRLADALAVLDEHAGRAATLAAVRDGAEALRRVAGTRPWLATMIIELAEATGLSLGMLARLLQDLPLQDAMTP